jgi:hypothetical protein
MLQRRVAAAFDFDVADSVLKQCQHTFVHCMQHDKTALSMLLVTLTAISAATRLCCVHTAAAAGSAAIEMYQ